MTFTEILAEARRISKTNSVSYSTADICASANKALERVVSIIRESEGRWKFDDRNYTDFNVGTTDLVANQQDYGLDVTHQRIERVEVLDENGDSHKLLQIDEADLYDSSLTDFMKTAGLPTYYDLTGGSIMLYPKPSYDLEDGLQVFYERGPSYFAVSDTTKSAGFATGYHNLIPMWCAYDYALINGLTTKNDLRGEITLLEDALAEHYARRNKDDRPRISIKKIKYN